VLQKDENPFLKSSRKKKPLILDGAMGSLLQQMGFKPDSKRWMTDLNRSSPDVIRSVHKSYIKAGADIITTNTFRTNPGALSAAGIYDVAPFVEEAVNIAKESINELPIYIAGSNAPAEDCYQIERKISYNQLEKNHKKHIDLLIENDVHFILNETQSHFDEIKIICNHCYNNRIPYVISLIFTERLKIFSGEKVENILKFVAEHEPLAIGFNCIAPGSFDNLLKRLEIDFNWGYYLNCAGDNYFKEKIVSAIDSIKYTRIVEKSLKFRPSFIGACCGSSPEHIKALKAFLNGKTN
jgi:homocysteine S-methyltransferase